MEMRWTSFESLRMMFTAIDLEGLDFLFVAAAFLGLYALHRLIAVQERGEVDETLAVNEVYREMRKAVRHVGNVAGLRRLTEFPYVLLRNLRGRDDLEDESLDGESEDVG
jgi:hypothetical protein